MFFISFFSRFIDRFAPCVLFRCAMLAHQFTVTSTCTYTNFYPSGRYLWMKVAGWISRSRPPLAVSAMFSPSLLPWFVHSNLLHNASRPFINPMHLTWHGYFMHVVCADIPTSHVVSYALSSTCLARACHGWNSTQNTCTENIRSRSILYKLTN